MSLNVDESCLRTHYDISRLLVRLSPGGRHYAPTYYSYYCYTYYCYYYYFRRKEYFVRYGKRIRIGGTVPSCVFIRNVVRARPYEASSTCRRIFRIGIPFVETRHNTLHTVPYYFTRCPFDSNAV